MDDHGSSKNSKIFNFDAEPLIQHFDGLCRYLTARFLIQGRMAVVWQDSPT